MKTILFQGDSITDCHRFRKATDKKQNSFAFFKDGKLLKKITALGDGYPAMVSAELESKFPGKYKYINKGVSGDRIPDVYSRIVQDIINIKPDYMSLLVGVNDVWRSFDSGCGTGKERFEKIYDILLDEIFTEFPDLKIIIMGPYVLPGPASDNTPEQPDRFREFTTAVAEMSDIAKKLAEKYSCTFIDLQAVLDEAIETVPVKELSGDGVHPTAKGHEVIRNEWLKAFEKITAGESK
jgi:lysophospholipase L1-like esterase